MRLQHSDLPRNDVFTAGPVCVNVDTPRSQGLAVTQGNPMQDQMKVECGHSDTPVVSCETRPRAWSATGAQPLLVLMALGLFGCAARSVSRSPTVVWVSHPRVYVGAADSNAFAPGDPIVIEKRGRFVAGGAVSRVDGEVATVVLSQGSLSGESDLRALAIRIAGAEAP